MNYTKNHHLPQWVSSDRIRMDDFNDAMASIDSSIISNENTSTHLQLLNVGFVAYCTPNNGTEYPSMNEAGRRCDYIAFK